MTTSEFNAKLEAKIKAIEKSNKPLELAVRDVMALQSKRIFISGKDADGGVIGTYKGGEIYVSPSANKGLPAFPLNGKPNTEGKTSDKKATVFNIRTQKKSRINVKSGGDARKTGYFTNYLAFKTTIGRNKLIKTVDLFLTGALHRNWANGKEGNNTLHYIPAMIINK